jgi:photosystem II stability/assembly factor-like uncharacterized protein
MRRSVPVRLVLAVLLSGATCLLPRDVAATTHQEPPRFKGIFEPISYSEPIDLTSAAFVDEQTGWVSGSAGTILHTSDGGDTWTAQLGGDPQSREDALTNLFLLDATHVWAVGGNVSTVQKRLLGTADGTTWRQVGVVGTELGSFTDYAFTSPSTGVFVNDKGEIHRTDDGGRTWRQVAACSARVRVGGVFRDAACNLKDLHFVDATVGYAVGGGASGVVIVMKTQDGGTTWEAVFAEPNRGGDNAAHLDQHLFFTDANRGVLRVATDEVLVTTDGGTTWETSVSELEGKIAFADTQVGWSISGYSAIDFSFTTNGGNSWSLRQLRFPADVVDFTLPARQRGYLVGDSGMIFRYRVVPADFRAPDIIEAPVMPAAPRGS